jgi:hypothetical protein
MNKKLSIKKAIMYAVDSVVSNPWYFVKLTFAWLGFSILFLTIPALVFGLIAISYASLIALIVGYFILYVFGVFIWFLPAKLLLRFHDKGPERLSLHVFLSQFNLGMVIKLILAAALFNLLVFAGIILLIIPGIYLMVKFIFVFLSIIDTDCGVIEAFRMSYHVTKDNFWRLCALLFIAGLLLNLIITIPISVLMMVHAYRQLNPAR